MATLKERIIRLLRRSERHTKMDMVYVASGALWANLSQVVFMAVSLAASVAFAHYLPKETYGSYQYVLSIAGLIAATTLTGMNSAVTRAVARGHEGELRKSVRFQLLAGILPTLIAAGVSLWYAAGQNSGLSLAFLWIALFLPTANAFNTWVAYTGGKKLFKIGSYYGFVNNIVQYGAIIACTIFTRNFVWIIFGNYLVNLINNVIIYRMVTRQVPPNDQTDDETVRYGTHLSLMSIPGAIAGQLDALLVFHFVGPTQLAVYSFATILPERLAGVLKFIPSIALPKLAQKSEQNAVRLVREKLWLMLALTAIAAGLYALLAPLVFTFLFPTYLDSVPFTQVYALSFFSVVGAFLQTVLTSQKKTRELYVLSTSLPILKIVLLVALMYFYGVWGILWAQIVAVAASIALPLYLMRRVTIRT